MRGWLLSTMALADGRDRERRARMARRSLPVAVPKTLTLLALVGAAFVLAPGCSTPSSPNGSTTKAGDAVALEGGASLLFEDGGALDVHRDTIEGIVKDTVSAVRALLPTSSRGVNIRILAGTSSVIPEIGMGGFTASTNEIRLTFDPDSTVLREALPMELFPLLAHELHHVARFRAIGYNSNLLDAMVTEGIADQFSIEVAGIDPPIWSTALSNADLATWSAIARVHWYDNPWNHDAWFFGADPSIPRWTGYSIGFDLTRTFLRAHPDRHPSELYAEPTRSFIPADGTS
jgi:Predicted Zn-dependent protease (DUF2268)